MGLNVGTIRSVLIKFDKKEFCKMFTKAPYRACTLPEMLATGKSAIKEEKALAKYCLNNPHLSAETVLEEFNCVTKNLDATTKTMLLELAENNKIKLLTQSDKKMVFLFNRSCNDTITLSKTDGVLNYLKNGGKDAENILKEALNIQKEGKLSPENISEILKLMKYDESTEGCIELLNALKTGVVNNSQIKQAQFLITNKIPLEIFNFKNISKYNKSDLLQWSNNMQGCRNKEYISGELYNAINKELLAIVKLNEVSPQISRKFLAEFANISKAFENDAYQIEKLFNAGGISTQYSREALKTDILGKIKHLSVKERNDILSKFGLEYEDKIIKGLPIYIKNKDLSSEMLAINEYIGKFLSSENKVVVPKGFEELGTAIDDICTAIPEFKFTIGAKQHTTQKFPLAEHMLKAFQENVKNPLYKELNPTDKKILGITTLLHDLGKSEKMVCPGHAHASSIYANSIVERMPQLTPMEKDRIINLVENHHWLEKINNNIKPEQIEEFVKIFRSGNDIKMAKIFAESDLKAVNNDFWNSYGYKINSNVTHEIEERILALQSKSRIIHTANVNTEKALNCGAEIRTLGQGENSTKNLVVDAKQLGLDKEYFGYHAGEENALITAISGSGYGNDMALSFSIGKLGSCATFKDYNQFIIFDKLNMNTIGNISRGGLNSKYGKSSNYVYRWMSTDKKFVNQFKSNYHHEISDNEYALISREAQSTELSLIHSNPKIQKILGSEEKALDFENALKETENYFTSTATNYSEAVATDLRAGAVGVKGKAENLGYDFRKFLADNNITIVENVY